ncbi:hypothetical protein BHU72_05740 [Desulfuribacillus stibiiarsenatis]|uniref:DNA-binding response regulator n=1 Tax=Desulfuribacillus stibiiarsenatis TaxID=1390249 RepID=A0A1E5L4M9_9FIRM|nr:response regulator transcription factor [Desulfuribacillus stibiiarsenatis]OEH85112.1 hypothetical protein BHU72_05740 [Desulfuribacillus stibiiarsenatis]
MSKGKVLVIDDEYKIRALIELYLIENEYEVLCADSGKTGIQAVERYRPDVIILDIMIPDMTGLDICKTIREKYAIPVIFLSCLQETETIISGLEIGGDDYMTKPFDPNVLIAKINALLRRTQAKVNIPTQKASGEIDSLTEQEFRILKWIEKGYTNKEIADKLQLKEGTIKVYNNTIFQKLNLKNRTQAIVKAKEEEVI